MVISKWAWERMEKQSLVKGFFTNLLLQTAERKKVIPFVGPSTQGPTSWPLCLRVGPSVHRAKSEYEFVKEVPLTLLNHIPKTLFIVIWDHWPRYLK